MNCKPLNFLSWLSEGFIFISNVNTPVPLSQELSVTQNSTEKIRVSSGSAIVLGLVDGFLNAKPTTAYFLTYLDGKCTANCRFCSQARSSRSRADMLSRVAWPVFQTEKAMSKLARVVQRDEIRRVCIQALNYPSVLDDLMALVEQVKSMDVPISVSCQPLNKREMIKLAKGGVERIGISLDAATKKVFDRAKGTLAGGPYDWDRQHDALLEAVNVFGQGRVSTHLIVGLGETEKEMVKTVQWCIDKDIYPALFAFTPIAGTALENCCPPPIGCYRRIQLARYLILQGKTRFENLHFSEKGHITCFGVLPRQLENIVRSGTPFLTSGCPHCNRPYYNEKPSGPLYNFPVPPTSREIREIERQLKSGF